MTKEHERVAEEMLRPVADVFADWPGTRRALKRDIAAALAAESARADLAIEKAKLADEFAQVLRDIRDEDGDIYGWYDPHCGESVVGMEVEDARDWLHKYEQLVYTPPEEHPCPTT